MWREGVIAQVGDHLGDGDLPGAHPAIRRESGSVGAAPAEQRLDLAPTPTNRIVFSVWTADPISSVTFSKREPPRPPAPERRSAGAQGAYCDLAVGALRAPLWSAALAQEAGSFTLENVTLEIGSAVHTLKTIRFVGVTTARSEVEALFGSGSTEPLSRRIARVERQGDHHPRDGLRPAL